MNLHRISHGDLEGLLDTASANGWSEITYDVREELQRRVAEQAREVRYGR